MCSAPRRDALHSAGLHPPTLRWARLQRYLLLGQTGHRVPKIVFLDAGLAAKFDPSIYSSAQVDTPPTPTPTRGPTLTLKPDPKPLPHP